MNLCRVTALALAALLLASCGGEDDEESASGTTTAAVRTTTEAAAPTEPAEPEQSAGDFSKEITEAALKSQFGKIWPRLHPAYQAETTRAEWEACQRAQADERAGIKMKSLDVLETYDDPYVAPKLGQVDAVAVTVRMRYEHPALEGEQEITDTVHVLNVNGEWRGLWKPEVFDAYRAGRCPD